MSRQSSIGPQGYLGLSIHLGEGKKKKKTRQGQPGNASMGELDFLRIITVGVKT